MSGRFVISYATEDEKRRKLVSILQRLGYRVEPGRPERLTVGQLARRVGRKVSTVSMSLRRPSCPDFIGKQGTKRLLWIEPNEELLTYLRENRRTKIL